jgi:hypothetical protein
VKSKEHYCWFKQSFAGFKGCFPLITFLYVNVIIFPADIEFGEEFFVCEVMNEISDKWKWVSIGNGPFI